MSRPHFYRAPVLPRSTLSAGARRSRAWRDVQRLGRRYRRWAGGALVAVGVWAALVAVAPPPPDTVAVAVAARDLAPGAVLGADDLDVREVTAADAPATALAVHDATGRVLASAHAPGEMVTATSLRGADLLRGVEAGLVALPLPLADPAAAGLVAPGDRVDVLAAVPTSTGTEVTVVGRDVSVLRAGGGSGTDDEWSLGADPSSDATVVVAVSGSQARAVVAGATDGSLWLAVRGTA